MKQHCRLFVGELEEFLSRHPDAVPPEPPPALAVHIRLCHGCHIRWREARASRALLSTLRPPGEPPADPYFYARLRTRIAAIEALRPARWVEIRWQHLALAAALFIAALGSFVYNLQRTETPNSDEAIVLDVPHINPQHPSDSHVRPRLADVMLNLMNP